MELQQIRCFYAAAKTENITKASENINISQPALSISVKKFEQELGVSLFNRVGKKIVLSSQGKKILPYCEKILSCTQEITKMCKSKKGYENRISIQVKAGSIIMPQVISEFIKNHDNISVELLDENKIGEPDIIIDATIENPLPQDIAAVFEEPIAVAVPLNHELANYSSIDVKELKKYPIIGLKTNHTMRQIEDFYLSRDRIKLSRTIECDNGNLYYTLLRAGAGIAFVAGKTWLMQNQSFCKLLPIQGRKWTRYITAKNTNFRDNSEIVKLFLDFYINYLSNL